MKLIHYFLVLFPLVICFGCRQHDQPERTMLFNDNWLFHYGDIKDGEKIDFDDTSWRKLDLPHDWTIEDIPGTGSPFDSTVVNGVASGFTKGGTGWYRKHFKINNSEKGRRYYIQFDGVYMNADVWINEHHLGNSYYGYSTFGYDISDFVKSDEDNIIAVQVKTEDVTSRWYSGSGIYRHVWLTSTSPLFIENFGTAITTHDASDDQASISVDHTIGNQTNDDINAVVRIKILDSANHEIVQEEKTFSVARGAVTTVHHRLRVDQPILWSIENPYLYTLVTEIFNGHTVTDSTREKFGIRTIQFDAEQGFLLNGKEVKLKGGCIHHDNGPLGAMAFDRAEERKVELHKTAGFNALRMAHNPPSPALLDACDRLGILVIDEAFDVWKQGHFENDYAKLFDELWKTDLERMVLRDRNHPSVITWSIGNEIAKNDTEEIAELAQTMGDYVRKLDPTRPVTAGVNAVSAKKSAYLNTLDVAGYNYSPAQYEAGHERNPNQLIYGSESYAREAYDYWKLVEEHKFVIGDFVWTSFDHMGEASIGWNGYYLKQNFYPWYLAYCGDMDICGNRRPQSYYRETLWSDKPLTHISVTPPSPSFPVNPEKEAWSVWDWPDEIDSWDFEGSEGTPLKVWVYTQCDEVELLFNNIPLGRKSNSAISKNKLGWEVPYQKGTLEAKGYINGKEVASSVLQSAGPVAGIRATADRNMISSGGQDLSYLSVDLIDSEGLIQTTANHIVTFHIAGEGSLLAVANSNPMSSESFRKNQRKAWRGQCMAIVRSGKKPGKITLTVSADGLPEATVTIDVK